MTQCEFEAIRETLQIEKQLIKAIPLPVGHVSNGAIYITVKSALGNSGQIRITDEQFKAIEKILLSN